MRTAKGDTWEQAYGALREMIVAEFSRHSYLLGSDKIEAHDRAAVNSVLAGAASESDYVGSLLYLARLLHAHHGRPVVLFVDDYDTLVMAGY